MPGPLRVQASSEKCLRLPIRYKDQLKMLIYTRKRRFFADSCLV